MEMKQKDEERRLIRRIVRSTSDRVVERSREGVRDCAKKETNIEGEDERGGIAQVIVELNACPCLVFFHPSFKLAVFVELARRSKESKSSAVPGTW